ncbi:hypothetical protein JNUCC1_03362 [Lentibacillus sp. JNUCC-1]|uniref:phage tail spike protein n=1 Tax=Lentibacillus sp. JNUCC-1 TaxID=2654513 RepID=UPI0012E7E58C|nr:phage tail spike protein [Lentibacillus sp. JNUCC-1]MUV39484.1 hypothetical protein [Lentibacillus sp. JNUCC-1]
MTIIHITDGQSNKILDFITAPNILDNNHRKSLKDNLETFDFETFGDRSFSGHLGQLNRVIIPEEDGAYQEFVIHESGKYHGADGLKAEVFSNASYLLLKQAKVIDPNKTSALTAEQHAAEFLSGTEWKPGNVVFKGVRTLTFEKHTNPFAALKKMAREFGLELKFRVEIKGGRIVGRYVDLVERIGKWRGREVEFGKDLAKIKRIEKTDNIVTALKGIGPERDDGSRLEVIVEDKDALARWGRNGQHLIEVYEPQSTDQGMTEEQLIQYTRTELNKRINAVVEYEAEIIDLENMLGYEHERIRHGDTIRIKDTSFEPPLYLEARVHLQDRDIKAEDRKTVQLGDYVEYTEDEVNAIWKQFRDQIRDKISNAELIEYTYNKLTIDDKDEVVFEEGKTFAQLRADKAQEAAEAVAVAKAELAETEAKAYADGEVSKEEARAIEDAEQKLKEAKKDAEQKAQAAENAAIGYTEDYAEKKRIESNAPPADQSALWIDTSITPNVIKRHDGISWIKLSPTEAAEIGAETPDGAQSKADGAESSAKGYADSQDGILKTAVEGYADTVSGQAESNAKSHADTVSQQAETRAKNYAVAKTVYDNKMTEIANDLSDKAGISYVDGQLQLKQGAIPQQPTAPSSPSVGMLWLDTSKIPNIMKRYTGTGWDKASPTEAGEVGSYTIAEIDNKINNVVSVTEYNADMDGVVSRLDTQSTQIGQNETAIGLKANQSEVDTISGKVSDNSAALTVQADEIASKVDSTTYTSGIKDAKSHADSAASSAESAAKSHADTKASQAEENAKGYTDKSLTIEDYPGTMKAFNNLASLASRSSSTKGVMLIKTPIDRRVMTRVKISGYNYRTDNSDVDLTISFYNYTTSILNHSYQNTGTKSIDKVRIGRDANDRVVIILGLDSTLWKYPAFTVDKAIMSYSTAPDSYKDGWDMEISASIPKDITKITTVKGSDYDSRVEKAETSITQNANAITQRATKTELNTLTGRVSDAESSITQNANKITSKVSQTDFNTLSGRVSTAESEIIQNADSIKTKVTDSEARSIFTQEANSFTFDADQINFTGHVFGEDATFAGDLVGNTFTSSYSESVEQLTTTYSTSFDADGFYTEEEINLAGNISGDFAEVKHGSVNLGTVQRGGRNTFMIISQNEIKTSRDLAIEANRLTLRTAASSANEGFDFETRDSPHHGFISSGDVGLKFTNSGINQLQARLANDNTYAEFAAADFRTPYGKADIVVDESIGANSGYIRYDNGLQICWETDTSSIETSSSIGGIAYTSKSFTFPKSFRFTPTISDASRRDAGLMWGGVRTFSTTGCSVYVLAPNTGITGYPGYVAIGRWK